MSNNSEYYTQKYLKYKKKYLTPEELILQKKLLKIYKYYTTPFSLKMEYLIVKKYNYIRA